MFVYWPERSGNSNYLEIAMMDNVNAQLSCVLVQATLILVRLSSKVKVAARMS